MLVRIREDTFREREREHSALDWRREQRRPGRADDMDMEAGPQESGRGHAFSGPAGMAWPSSSSS